MPVPALAPAFDLRRQDQHQSHEADEDEHQTGQMVNRASDLQRHALPLSLKPIIAG